MKRNSDNLAWQKISDRIKERTGLTTEPYIDAYADFCQCADTEDGVIMLGNVQHMIYRTLLQEATQLIKDSEAKFYDDHFNNPNRPKDTPESPLSEEARKTTELYLERFQDSGLITLPMKVRECSELYPILKGYRKQKIKLQQDWNVF